MEMRSKLWPPLARVRGALLGLWRAAFVANVSGVSARTGIAAVHRGRLEPKFRQPSTWRVSPELCARSRDRAAKACSRTPTRRPVGTVKGYHQAIVEIPTISCEKKRDLYTDQFHTLHTSQELEIASGTLNKPFVPVRNNINNLPSAAWWYGGEGRRRRRTRRRRGG